MDILNSKEASLLMQNIGEDRVLVIPDNFYAINFYAFENCDLARLVAGENIEKIEDAAFRHARIGVIDLSKTKITELAEDAFVYSNVDEIILPDTLKVINQFAFSGSKIKKLTIPPHVTHIQRFAFDECVNLEKIDIPESVLDIDKDAFNGCTNLKEIKLPNTLLTLKGGIFKGCSQLSEIKIPETVKIIESEAFKGCSQLKKIKFPENLVSIYSNAFQRCSQLTEIEFPEKLERINSWAFADCTNLRSVKFPKNLREIDSNAFNSCENLEEIDFGNVEVIRDSAFANTGIKNLVVPGGIKVIGSGAFKNCKIQNLVLSDGINKIEGGAFRDNTELEEVVIPDSVTSIGRMAFDGCVNLKHIKFPDSLEDLEFQGDLGNVEKIVLPKNLKSLGYKAFIDSKKLKEIEIPETTSIIGDEALANTGIEYIKLPKNLDFLGGEAFSHCSKLKEVEIPSNIVTLHNKLFADCESLGKIKLNDNITYIEDEVFKNCNSLTSLEFPPSVVRVGKRVFENCKNLERIVFNSPIVFSSGSFEKLSPKTKFISFKEGSELVGSMNISPLKYYTKKGSKIFLSAEPIDETSFCFGDYVREGGAQPKFDYVLGMQQEKDNFKKLFKDCPMFIDLFNLILEEKGFQGFKKFYYDNKDNFKFFKQCAKLVPEGLENDFCKLYFDLGGFEKNYTNIKTGKNGEKVEKTVNYSQRVGEFLKSMLVEQPWFFDKKYISNLRFNGIKEDFSNFILNKENFLETIKECKNIPEFFVKFYNEFEQAQMQNTSNKGSQRQLKPTIKSFKKYMFKDVFKGAEEHPGIAYALQQYFDNQETFNEAVEIDDERIAKKVPNNLTQSPIKGFSKIDQLSEDIKNQARGTMSEIVSITNGLTYEFLSKDDPNNFILGKLVSCCAHLEGAGYGIMHASIVHPDVQNLVIRDDKGEIIAKSTLYINREQGYGVFNNVEVDYDVRDYQKEEIFKAYIDAVNEFAKTYNKENPNKPLKIITVGANLNDLYRSLKSNTRESSVLYKSLDYRDYGKPNGRSYNGDSQDKQFVLWEKEE